MRLLSRCEGVCRPRRLPETARCQPAAVSLHRRRKTRSWCSIRRLAYGSAAPAPAVSRPHDTPRDVPCNSFVQRRVAVHPLRPVCPQEEGKPLKAPKVPKVKRPGTAYALFVKEKYTSISDTLPAGERSVSLVRSTFQTSEDGSLAALRVVPGLQRAQGQRAMPAHARIPESLVRTRRLLPIVFQLHAT